MTHGVKQHSIAQPLDGGGAVNHNSDQPSERGIARHPEMSPNGTQPARLDGWSGAYAVKEQRR
jgi:hypothetical protein